MDITNSQKVYETTLAQRNASYRYALFNCEKVNVRFNNYYIKKKNDTFRKTKIEKVKKKHYYKQEVKKFLNILIDETEEIE